MARSRLFTESDNSPLVDDLVTTFQENLHLFDPTPIYAMIGTLAGGMMKQYPPWLMLVAAPSAGKTFLLMPLTGVPRVDTLGQMKSSAALLTANKKGGTGGKLREMGDYGALIIKDFTSVLSLHPESKTEVIGALREVGDGKYDREVGTDGHQTLRWVGRATLLAGVTTAIDAEAQTSSDLGERWLYCRLNPSDDGVPEMDKMLADYDPFGAAQRRSDAVRDLFDYCGVEWDMEVPESVRITQKEHRRLTQIAGLVAKMRGVVRRDKYSHEIVTPASAEAPMRIYRSLTSMVHGMRVLGVGPTAVWNTVRKVALDSTTENRMLTVKHIAAMQRIGEDACVDCMKDCVGIGGSTMRRELENLEKLGILDKYKVDDKKDAWRLKPDYYKEMTA